MTVSETRGDAVAQQHGKSFETLTAHTRSHTAISILLIISIRLILDTHLSHVQLPPAACLCLTSASLPLSTLLIRLPTLTDLHPVVVAALRSERQQSTRTDRRTNTCHQDSNHVLESELTIKQDRLCSFCRKRENL